MNTLLLDQEERYKGTLILVNRQYPLHNVTAMKKAAGSADRLRAMSVGSDLVCVDEDYPDICLDQQAARVLRKALEELGCMGSVVPVSGYRSRSEQEKIYRESLEDNGPDFTKKYVALPDRSEHQTGLAIDLGDGSRELDFIRPAFPDEGMCGRFKRAAARYGYTLRYPAGKEKVTGIAYEPWHFRYVGYPHSMIMEEQGMVLEEYLEFLRRQPDGCLVWQQDGRPMEIRYVKACEPATRVQVPEDCLYQVSGDNKDGFVVTIWRKW